MNCFKIPPKLHNFVRFQRCKVYLIVDDDGAQAVQKEQQGGVHIMEEIPGLMALRAQGKADLSGPADERTNAVR